MKTSRIVLWSGAAFLGLLILASLISLKISLGRDMGPISGDEISYSGDDSRFEVDTRGVRRIKLQGGWQVKLIPGGGGGEVIIPAEAEEHLEIVKRGEELFIGLEKGFRIGEGAPYKIELSLEALEGIELEGASDMRIEDFDSQRLEIRIAGASNILALNCSAEELIVRTEGASNLDLDASRFVNANLEMEGASNVEIELAGGVLEGRVSGIASVVYGGEVSEYRLRTEGPASVERR